MEVQVEGHLVCNWSREGTLEYLTCANESCVTFGYEIVVKNRVFVWFSEKGVGSVVGGQDREAAVCDNKFNHDGVEHSS